MEKSGSVFLIIGGIVAFAIISFFSLTSCTDNSDDYHSVILNEETHTPKQLNFIGHWFGEGAKEQLVRDLTREYEFLNQEVLINLKFPEEVYYDQSQINTQAQFVEELLNNSSPDWDIIRIEYPLVSTYLNDPTWSKEHLVDFSQIPEFRKSVKPELLSEEYKNENWGGILPGPFIEGQYWSLFFNKKVANKLGIDIKSTGMTIDDFKSYCKALSQYNNANPDQRIVVFPDDGGWAVNIGMQLFASLHGDLTEFRAPFTPNKLDKWNEVLTALEEIADYDIFTSPDEYFDWNKSNEYLLNAKSLFQVNGSWMFNIWEAMDAEKVWDCAPAELPSFGSTSIYPMGYACTWGVFKHAPNKQEAIDFLLWINSEQTAKEWVRNTKSPSGIKASGINTVLGTDQFESFTNYLSQKYSKGAYSARMGSWDIFGERNKWQPNYAREVVRGEITADETMEKIRAYY